MKVLIIDDDKDLLCFLSSGLKSQNYNIDTANNGLLGSLLLHRNKYNLIILDPNFPGKKGEQICREIRRQEENTPIIILTKETKIESKVKLFDYGVDDYLTKPFHFKELCARMQVLLRRPQQHHNSSLRTQDLVLNEQRQQVFRAGKEIKLTPKEYQLLKLLLKKPEEIIHKNDIFGHIWGQEAGLLSKSLETHVFNLRKKINKGHENKLIKTVLGQGYKLS